MGIYTNTSAFRRALLTSDIYSENIKEQKLLAEAQRRMQDEQEDRFSNSFLGKIVGGTIGFFVGGPPGLSIGMNMGSVAGMNHNNTDYKHFLPSPNALAGKFYAHEGVQARDALQDFGNDLDNKQTAMSQSSMLQLAFTAGLTKFGDALNMNKEVLIPDIDNPGQFIAKVDVSGNTMMQKNWYEMNFGEKINHHKNYLVGNKMEDFLEGMENITSSSDLTGAVAKGVAAGVTESDINLFETAFNKNIMNTMETDISKVLNNVSSSEIGISLDTINSSLLEFGYEPISSDLFDIIKMNDSNIGNTFPENFNWGVFK